MYFRVCECGAFLDPGEICEDCRQKERAATRAGTSGSGNAKYDSGMIPQKEQISNEKHNSYPASA